MEAVNIEASSYSNVDDLTEAVIDTLDSQPRAVISFINPPVWSSSAIWELWACFPRKRVTICMFSQYIMDAIREAVAIASDEVDDDDSDLPEQRRYVYGRVRDLLLKREEPTRDTRQTDLEGRVYRSGLWLNPRKDTDLG